MSTPFEALAGIDLNDAMGEQLPSLPPGMPDLGSIFRMAQDAANGMAAQQRKAPKPPKRFVGPGAAVFALLCSWLGATAAHPLSHAAHSAGNFFVHDPWYAGAVALSGLLQPRFVKIIRKARASK